MENSISYAGQQVSVSNEVADFLESDRKRSAAQRKQEQRHRSKSDFERVLSCYYQDSRPVEDNALKNLSLEKLRTAVCGLTAREQELIVLRFVRELTMEQIGELLGVSKMAISKQLKKLLEKLRGSVV